MCHYNVMFSKLIRAPREIKHITFYNSNFINAINEELMNLVEIRVPNEQYQ